jgi:hypothetical protein
MKQTVSIVDNKENLSNICLSSKILDSNNRIAIKNSIYDSTVALLDCCVQYTAKLTRNTATSRNKSSNDRSNDSFIGYFNNIEDMLQSLVHRTQSLQIKFAKIIDEKNITYMQGSDNVLLDYERILNPPFNLLKPSKIPTQANIRGISQVSYFSL